ncbi:hypothetical protein TWF481_002780 [Arthrobotrys musiformis]|uniref:Uncharacterized protein n=1 Tax=Arthrobotrys musiformis TaxID=47236 RepID=A0AAV9VSB2_9PEZI
MSFVGPRSTIEQLIEEHGRGEGFKPLPNGHPDLDNAISSLADKVTELFDIADENKKSQRIHTRRLNQLEK